MAGQAQPWFIVSPKELLRSDRHIIHEEVRGLILIRRVGAFEEEHHLLALVG